MRIARLLAVLASCLLACQPASSDTPVDASATPAAPSNPTEPAPAEPVAPGPVAPTVPANAGAEAPAANVPDEAIVVEVWHDYSCPWCRIGMHNLNQTLLTVNVPVTVMVHPYLLDDTLPPEGVDLRQRLGERYPGNNVETMFARVTEAGAQVGLTFNWEAVRVSPRTVAAHALTAWVDESQRTRLMHALHEAYFLRGENIGDTGVLVAIGESIGLNPEEARSVVTDPSRLRAIEAEVQGGSRSIRGVPYFVIGGQALSGAQPVHQLTAAIQAAIASR